VKRILILAVVAIALISVAGAANYMYEKASVKGVGYKNGSCMSFTESAL
jgi:opacity protein-like surface antigen